MIKIPFDLNKNLGAKSGLGFPKSLEMQKAYLHFNNTNKP